MSYGLKYSIPFLNRENVSCEVQLLEKDYGGASTTLEGGEKPFIMQSLAQDNVIPLGIKATEATIEFYSDNLVSLSDFYSEDDTHWLVRFYAAAEIQWTGFLQLDNCSEAITDITHIISLNANDGLARLQTQYFISTAVSTEGQPLIVNWTLLELIVGYILSSVGLEINCKAWLNIFENSTEDRDDHNYLTLLPQTAFSTSYFVNDDGTTKNLYEVLDALLRAFRCVLTQAEGVWQIMRWGDIWIFDDGTMPGTLYSDGGGSYEEIIYQSPLEVGRGLSVEPINENQRSSILRPFQYSKETFNYEQPVIITQYNLQIASGATPYSTTTVGDFRYDDYSIPDYFPTWVQRGGVTSYLEIVTNTITNEEADRYIVIIGDGALEGGVQFNPIQVAANDELDISMSVKSLNGDNNPGKFWMRAILLTPDSEFYVLARVELIIDSLPYSGSKWFGPYPTTEWDSPPDVSIGVGTEPAYLFFSYVTDNTWQDISMFADKEPGTRIPLIPVDGILLLQCNGSNLRDSDRYNSAFKSISVSVKNFINQNIQITGQFHNSAQDADIRNNEQYQVGYDDSPRNSIRGTLFTDALSDFEYTDSTTGEDTDLGSLYFTRTSTWHRQGISEANKLGDLNTFNDMFAQRVVRTIISGDFFGLTGIHLMRLIKFSWLPTRKFMFGAASFDWMSCIWNATLYELYKDEDKVIGSAFMAGTKDEQLSVISGVVHFDSVTYYGGANGYITDSDTISKFTYAGIDRTIDISVIFYVPISGSGIATFTIQKNGVVIATQTLDASAHFGRISFDLRGEAVTSGDYFQAFIDTGGADVDIQSGSINITIDGIIDTALFNYTFTYIYSAQ